MWLMIRPLFYDLLNFHGILEVLYCQKIMLAGTMQTKVLSKRLLNRRSQTQNSGKPKPKPKPNPDPSKTAFKEAEVETEANSF